MQIEDQMAVDGGLLDSTVVWDITADQGFSLDIEDFSFTGATQLNVPATLPPSTSWENLPYPILYAKMVKVSSVLIRVTLYLAPDASQPGLGVGNSFVMPSTDTNVTVPIEGCAKIAGHSMRLWFNEPAGNNTITEITVNPDLEKRLAQVGEGEGGLKSHEVVGTLPPQALDKVASSSGDYLMSYVVVASSGYRYKSTPTLSINSKLYNVESFAQLTPSSYEEGKNNITGVRFEIYKK
tara:strand:- start:1262 stop:1975 length:714 start_codon:yes stop_codon:yes gene_type:complete